MSNSPLPQSDLSATRSEASPREFGSNRGQAKIRIYSHSAILYWWPVWLTGYIMAALTQYQGTDVAIGQTRSMFHESSNLGLIFFVVLFLVILVTNYAVRGLSSLIIILTLVLTFVLLLYFNLWESFFGWFISHKIYLNGAAYFWFSNLMFGMWLVITFGFDRLSYWEFEPGQMTSEFLLGSGSKSYNTQGMMLEKHQDDIFRHWLLGLGSGDLRVRTSGAIREQIDIHNVLFVSRKLAAIQHLIAEVPEE